MTTTVRSYVQDRWLEPSKDASGAEIHNPATGELTAVIAGGTVDTGEMVRHAREVGGPALRAMTFHQRALLLKKLGAYLTENTDAIYARYAAGATLADARVDVEGGIQTVQYYAGLGLKELPGTSYYAEGSTTKLGKGFRGQVVLTPKKGVAVLIGAYNFPVWGFLEKLGPALLAGLPVIVKPATQTGHIAEAAFAAIIDSGVMPRGSVQLVSGSARDLLDHLGGQDVVAFTGSGATAAKLRAHPAVIERGCHLNAETDSLNATVLGPDVTPDSALFTAFVKGISREMTSKTGQKCTAIRRVLVPADHVDAVVAGLRTALGKVVIGDPAVDGTTMGPLVSAAQAQDVRDVVRRLSVEADVVIGGVDEPVHVASGDAEHGAFVAPTVLVAHEGAQLVHTLEPFGPVATIVPVADMADAARVAALGEGSLVASLVTNSPDAVEAFVMDAGSFHGRVLVLDDACADTAMPHGAVMPQSIHGGPGRAGGGEELGGVRGVLSLMQATSLTGSPRMLQDFTQTWNDGVEPHSTGVHPFRRYLDDLELGETLFTESRTVTQEDVEHFAHFTGDTFYAHMDDEAASASPIFGGRVAHGYLILAFAAGLFVDPEPGPVLANFGLENLRFVKPLMFGDSMRMRLTAKHKTERPGAGWGEVTWDCQVWNQNDDVVATYDLLTINAARP